MPGQAPLGFLDRLLRFLCFLYPFFGFLGFLGYIRYVISTSATGSKWESFKETGKDLFGGLVSGFSEKTDDLGDSLETAYDNLAKVGDGP